MAGRLFDIIWGRFVQLEEVGNGIDPVVGREKEPPFSNKENVLFGWRNLN